MKLILSLAILLLCGCGESINEDDMIITFISSDDKDLTSYRFNSNANNGIYIYSNKKFNVGDRVELVLAVENEE